MKLPQNVNPWEELFHLFKSNFNSNEQFRVVCLMGLLSVFILIMLTGVVLVCAFKRRAHKNTVINTRTAIEIIENLEENTMFLQQVAQILMQPKTIDNSSGDGMENMIKAKPELDEGQKGKVAQQSNGVARKRTTTSNTSNQLSKRN